MYLLGLAVLLPLGAVLWRRHGLLVPALAILATAAFMVFVARYIPGSPDACLAVRGGNCAGHMTGVVAMCFAVPAGVGALLARRGGGGGD
jgi:hypothetical protein